MIRRHSIPRACYRAQNWPAYKAGRRRRSDLSFWLVAPALAGCQGRCDKRAAKRFLRKLLKQQCRPPRVMITDKLESYGAARKEITPGSSTGNVRV